MKKDNISNLESIKKIINIQFTKEKIVKNVTSYTLYYQISLGNYVFTTMQNNEERIKKLKELNLSLNPNEILLKIADIIVEHFGQKDFENNFDDYLKVNSINNSLLDFVSKDKELLNKERFIKSKQEDILNNKFFSTTMKMQYLGEYQNMNKHYYNLFDDKYLLEVKEIILANYTKKLIN